MSQTHRDDAGIVECGDELDCCASLQQSAEELASTQLCASRGIWCVNCEDGVGASDQLLRIDDARADVGVGPCREQSTRTRVVFHQDIDSTGPQSLHTGGSHGHPRLAGRSLLEGADCDRHIAGLPNSPFAPPDHATLSRRQGSVVRYLRRCTCSTLGRSRLHRKGRSAPPAGLWSRFTGTDGRGAARLQASGARVVKCEDRDPDVANDGVALPSRTRTRLTDCRMSSTTESPSRSDQEPALARWFGKVRPCSR
jgi:hypothetical protein